MTTGEKSSDMKLSNNDVKALRAKYKRKITLLNRFNCSFTTSFQQSAVKAVKQSLHKVLKDRVLTFEEYNTLFYQIEAALNSRLLCSSGDGYLTPGHFLSGRHLLLPGECNDLEVDLTQRKHLTEQLYRDFWNSWYKDYLNKLNSRSKWVKLEENLRPGDVVPIVLPNMKPTFWLLGRVTVGQMAWFGAPW